MRDSSDDIFADERSPISRRRRKVEQPLSLKAQAVKFLARREYSRTELARKLTRLQEEPVDNDELEKLLDELQEKGYLSDERFAHSFTRTKAARTGNLKLVAQMKEKGLSSEVIREAIQEEAGSELERASTLWHRKFGAPADDYKGYAKQVRYLLSRGFSLQATKAAIASGSKVSFEEQDY